MWSLASQFLVLQGTWTGARLCGCKAFARSLESVETLQNGLDMTSMSKAFQEVVVSCSAQARLNWRRRGPLYWNSTASKAGGSHDWLRFLRKRWFFTTRTICSTACDLDLALDVIFNVLHSMSHLYPFMFALILREYFGTSFSKSDFGPVFLGQSVLPRHALGRAMCSSASLGFWKLVNGLQGNS